MSEPSEMSEALGKTFPREAIRQRQGGGGRMLDYVEGHTVIHRLIDATGNRWDFAVDRIERIEIDQANALMMAYVTLEIPGLGRRSHVGVQAVNARGGEDLVKGAVTDALKKAATLFGVGLELYGPDYEAGELDAPRTQMPAKLPPRGRTTSENTIPPAEDAGPGSWTQFWAEARKAGLMSWPAIEKALGVKQEQFRHAGEALDALHEKMQAATV